VYITRLIKTLLDVKGLVIEDIKKYIADVTAALSPLQKLTRRVNKYFSVAENKVIGALKFINKKAVKNHCNCNYFVIK
jgi:hypothetical protein